MKPALFVLSNASHYGGAEKSIEAILPALAERYRLFVFAENARHIDAIRKLSLPDCRIEALEGGNRIDTWFRTTRRVRRLSQKFEPRALVANTNKAGLLAVLVQRSSRGRLPVLVFVRDFLWKYRRLIFGALGAHIVVAPSEAVAEHEVWKTILGPASVRVVPDAVADPPESSREAASAGMVVLCLANIARWKGLHFLVEAFESVIARELPGARLLIAGSTHESEYLQELEGLIDRCDLRSRVTLLPYVDDVERLYREAAVVVSSSISAFGGPETFGRTVIEAWAHGKPVVAFAVGGPKYLIADGVDGLLVPEGDPRALGEAVCRVLKDRAFARALGRAGQARARREFSVEAVANRLHDLLVELMGYETRVGEGEPEQAGGFR